MLKNATYTLVYALITIAGGSAGYVFAGSIPSLIASSVSGTLLLLCSIAMLRNHKWGHYVALFAGSLLTCFFAFRFGKQPAPIPLGMAILSATYAYLLYKSYLTQRLS